MMIAGNCPKLNDRPILIAVTSALTVAGNSTQKAAATRLAHMRPHPLHVVIVFLLWLRGQLVVRAPAALCRI